MPGESSLDLGLDVDTVATDEPSRVDAVPHAVASLSLVVMSPTFAATYPLPASGQVTIGRARSAEVFVDDGSVSRNHAVVTITPRLAIRDLGSSNGTRVGGTPIAPEAEHPLRPGDAITVGGATLLLQPSAVALAPRRFWAASDFEVRIEEECARAQRAGAVFVVASLRVDRLALDVEVRQVLARRVRSSDVMSEYGAQEYAVLLNDASLAQARGVLDRIVADLAAHDVTARWGAAEYPRDAKSAHRLVAAAQIAAREEPAALATGKGPVIADPRMIELVAFVKMIAAGDLGVLLLGETGVGKEVLAEEVHRLSARAGGPFVRLNCAALSEPLLESELFGHERGAFTGADKAKAGLIESAAGGTVFLDEIGELPMNLQVKLLRVLEEKQALRVGGLKPVPLDVRFVAATNRDLERQASRGLFREDLYYRLAGATVTIPALRERVADIEPLARMFVANAAAHLGGRQLAIDAEALACLRAHAWPGNVRELRNVIERAALICGAGPIGLEHLPPSVRRTDGERADSAGTLRARPSDTATPAEGPGPDGARILEVLAACGGNQSRAARALGISRPALIRRLEKLGAVRPRKP